MWPFWICPDQTCKTQSHVICSVLNRVTAWSLALCRCCSGRMELCEEAKCLPAQNILGNDRKLTLAGVLQIHRGSFTPLPRADVN